MFGLVRESDPPARRPLSSWTAFWLVTGVLAVMGWLLALGGVAALGAMGTRSCNFSIPSQVCSQLWLWILFGGWVGAIVAAVVGALVGARAERSLWSGYPLSVVLYAFGVVAAYVIAFG